MVRTLIDHSTAPVTRTTWRTYLVLAHTLSGSAKVAGRAALGRLTPEKVDRTVDRWCQHCFRLARASLVVDGQEHVEPGQPYVLLSNHQSLLDIPAVVLAFPGRLRFVAKQELRAVPVFGAAMEDAGIVFVDRKHRDRAIEQLGAVGERIREGTSVWIAAEGTRSRDGTLGPFKKGGFHVALQLGVPILPTWIEGTLDVIPPDQWGSVTGQTVQVQFAPPIPTRGLGRADLEPLMTRTRASLLELARRTGSQAAAPS